MIQIVGPITTGEAAGADGSATNNENTTQPVVGKLLGVYLKYNDSPPAGTTDIVLKTKGTSPSPPSETLLSIANAATDGWFYPRTQVNLNSDGSAIANEYDIMPIHDILNFAITGANAGDYVEAWLMLETG